MYVCMYVCVRARARTYVCTYKRLYLKVSGLSHKEIYVYLCYCLLRSNTKGYGDKTHYTDSRNCDTTAPNGRELYHLQFSLQAASPETCGYTMLLTISSSLFYRRFGKGKR
jgi:hypothetical protein